MMRRRKEREKGADNHGEEEGGRMGMRRKKGRRMRKEGKGDGCR